MTGGGDAPALVLLGLTGAAVFYWDIRYLRIPDWLTWGGWGTGVVLAYRSGTGPLVDYLGGSAGAFLFFFMVYHLYPGGIGGGDVKLSGLVGGFGGLGGWFFACHTALLLAMIFVGIFPDFRGNRKIPFGPFLWTGGMIVWLVRRGGPG